MWLQASAANDQLIAAGAAIAAEHGAELNAVITTPKLARSGHWAVGGMVSGMAAEVETRAERAAVELAGALEGARRAAGVLGRHDHPGAGAASVRRVRGGEGAHI